MDDDYYLTIAGPAFSEFKEKGSRFIGRAKPVDSREQAERFLDDIRNKYYDATHNCFAYSVGTGKDQLSRYSDDGEPTGTAGKPILQVILGRSLTNIGLVVTRYFGGTKLGTGGLTRAYSHSASLTLDNAKIKKNYLLKTLVIKFGFEWASVVYNLVESFDVQIIQQNYSEQTELVARIRLGRAEAFVSQLLEKTAGKVEISEGAK